VLSDTIHKGDGGRLGVLIFLSSFPLMKMVLVVIKLINNEIG